MDVYNIKTKKVETSIKLNSKGKNYKIYYKYNIILIINDAQIYIIDSKKFRIIKEIKSKPEPEKKDNESKRNYSVWGYSNYEDPFVEELEKYHKYVYGEILTANSIGIIYEGNLYYLEDNNSDSSFEKVDIINSEDGYDDYRTWKL